MDIINEKMTEVHEEHEKLTPEMRMLRAIYKIRDVFPFYVSAFLAINKVPVKFIDTIGVNEKEIIYNEDFVNKLTDSELRFIIMHELCHMALKHVSRGYTKNSELWNVAVDLIVNKLLSDEILTHTADSDRPDMRLKPGKTVEIFGFEVKMPKDALYSDYIDLDCISAEALYDSLLNENGDSNNQNNNSNNQDNDSSGSGGCGVSGNFISVPNGNGTYSEMLVSNDYVCDLKPEYDSPVLGEQECNNTIEKIQMKSKMDSYGDGSAEGGLLQKKLLEIMKPKFNWKRYVEKHCIKMTSSDVSFRRPDKRMYYQNLIYPGKDIDELGLVGIKICIDISGSISDKEKQYILGILFGLTSKYKVDAELIQWDTEIVSCEKFTDKTKVDKVLVCDGGGTDPKCLFDYFNSKKCKVKPELVIILTDGYFGTEYATGLNKRKYKNTLWIMSESARESFKPAFGIVAKPEYN